MRFVFSPPATEAAGLLNLPWSQPLEEWDDERMVEIRQRGIHRHVVRFVADEGGLYALKSISERLARREYQVLRALAELGVPAVEVVGIAVDLGPGADAVLVTKFLTYATTYRAVFSSPRGGGPPADKLLDALVELLARLHMSGFFWGDCSLSNTLFRYDAGALRAYLVDAETSEQHRELSDGQRRFDVELAVERVYGELLDLEAGDLLPAALDPLELAEELERRYAGLWHELTREEVIPLDEQRFRIAERLRRLNELGFAAEEVELISAPDGNRLRVRTRVADAGDNSRKLFLRTGIDAGENQARRLLNDIASFRAYLEQKNRRPVSEVVAANRWLTEVYDPVVEAIPPGLRGRLAPAEVFHEILEHRWYMSEQAGRDVGTTAAARSYFKRVLPQAPQRLDESIGSGGEDGLTVIRRRGGTLYMATQVNTAAVAGHKPADWWRQAVVYQVYPRSFADSNGDGIGDLRGILSRVPYLASLGIDAVWLSPFYPSALVDGGYDVDDYRDVDPRLGALADFDEMTARLHASGIKVMVDIVPNHTSSRHAWFREALAAPKGSPARDRYIFRDGLGPDGARPPSDWTSMFGGRAWTRVHDGQWYLHLFAAEQPDLNWENREVRADFLTTLRFWSDRGADGFRVDVAHGLAKDLAEPLQPLPAAHHPAGLAVPPGSHPLWDRDEVHDIYAEWRQVFNEYEPPRVGVAEAWVHPSRRPRYASPSGLGQAFNFDLLKANWSAGDFLRVITDSLAEAQRHGASTTWVLSNHDVVRHASRYGLPAQDHLDSMENAKPWLLSNGTSPPIDRGLGLRRARAATLLMLALPGSAYLYQGEELGLPEVADIPAELIQDPSFLRSGGADKGRDGCRVPLPWTTDGPSFGFGAGPAHLPQPAWFGPLSVQGQDHDPASTLSMYRQALGWRRRLRTAERLEWMPAVNAQVLHFARPGGWQSVTNFGPVAVPLPPGTVAVTSAHLEDGLLPADATAWIVGG